MELVGGGLLCRLSLVRLLYLLRLFVYLLACLFVVGCAGTRFARWFRDGVYDAVKMDWQQYQENGSKSLCLFHRGQSIQATLLIWARRFKCRG